MTPLLARLLEILDLDPIGSDLFRGRSEADRHGRIFGGQVVGQALVAGQRTVEGRAAHSLHAYFLSPGDPAREIVFRVERSREGRAFATRQVVARQDGEVIFQMIASFQRSEEGYEHQLAPMPEAPDPETLLPHVELVAQRADRVPEAARGWVGRPRAIDMRFAVAPYAYGGDVGTEPSLAWFRAPGALPDDPDLHRALIAYATDMSFNDSAIRVHGHDGPHGEPVMSSLDHALWLHTDARADEWLLFASESPRAGSARGFVRGAVYRRDGVLVASVAQESLMRPRTQPGPSTPSRRKVLT